MICSYIVPFLELWALMG